MMNRILGVFKLDARTFEEIEHNTGLTLTAALIVVVVSVVSGVGNGLAGRYIDQDFTAGFIGGLIGALLGWLLWSVATLFVGTKLFKGEADLGQMLRVIGFAYLPLLFSIIPCIGGLIGIIWAIAAGFVAIRQGLDLDDLKAFFTVAVGAGVYVLLTVILNAIL